MTISHAHTRIIGMFNEANVTCGGVVRAEAVFGANGERRTAGVTFQAHDRARLRRRELRATLLSLPARGRLRQVPLGLGDRAPSLLGVLLLRRVSVSLHADARHRHTCPSAAAAAARATGRRRRWSLLFAETHLFHLDALLRRV